MQRPTDLLRAEHALVARSAQILCAMAQAVHTGLPFPADDCAKVLRFLREWVLAVHMRKEDEVVAPAVAMRGDERSAEVVGQLLRLHEEIAELSHSLVLFWEPIGELTAPERQGFVDTVSAVVSRIEQRQSLEEQVLFPACDASVPADDQMDWAQEFAQLETDRGGAARWAPSIDRLAATWLG